MRRRSVAVALVALAAATTMSACGSSGGSDPDSTKGVTLTYWASNQGTSLQNDKDVLAPQLTAFTKQTGIKVKLQVVPWANLLNNILTATTSGKGPDVLNIGNTWSASLQATGAFVQFDKAQMAKVGGSSRFLAGSLSATGASGKAPTAVPLYSLAYGLYYNKKYFQQAGIATPPSTWPQFLADAKKLTTPQHWGVSIEGGSVSENIHNVFTFSQQQGGSFYNRTGKPTFDTPQNVAAVRQYIDLVGKEKVANPSDAEYSNGTEALTDFAKGKAAMVFWQAAAGSLKQLGMPAADIGVAPLPLPAPTPAGGKKVTSMVAGINLAVFKNTRHLAAALKFVQFMTSTPVQESLNSTYGSLPTVSAAYGNAAFKTPAVATFKNILSTSAAPMPAVSSESQFETLVGTLVKNLLASAATGKQVSDAQIGSGLKAAQQQLNGGG